MPVPNSADTERGPERAAAAGPGDQPAGEFAAIGRIEAALRAHVPGPPPGEVWIGDDAAVLPVACGRLLLTTDVAVVGVHADLDVMTVADLGWRALVASVSDVAAMGGRPRHAVAAVAGPPDSDLDGLAEGMAEAAAAFDCPVVGGDLSAAAQLSVAVTVTGDVPDAPGPVLRSGARPGDHVFVTGPLGGSAAGLRLLRALGGGPTAVPASPEEAALVSAYRRPRPRPAEGAVARRAGASAMVDVSDGLAADLVRLCAASGVGVRLDDVPMQWGVRFEEALGGGEDYELVVVTPDADALVQGFARAGLRAPLRIGTCDRDPAVRTLRGEPLPVAGWEHRFATPPSRGPS